MAVKYVIVIGDRFETDQDKHYLSLSQQDLEYAKRWYDELARTLAAMPDFPGPLSHARDEEASDLFGREVRRLLY